MNKQLYNGTEFGYLRILALCGDGGTASVYLVRDSRNGRTCALKVLSGERAAERPALEQFFLREAELQKRVSSNHVVPVIEVMHETPLGVPAFLMENIEGSNVSDYINNTPSIPLSEALRIASETACALADIHRQGIIHGDIKPANLLLDHDGKIFVCDFGSASEFEKSENSICEGTPLYASPEQCRCERLTPASDIYSLGVCLYLLCTRHQPFPDRGSGTGLRKISTDYRPASELNPAVSSSLDQLIADMLQPNPALRIHDARKLIRRIRREQRAFEPSSPWKIRIGSAAGIVLLLAALSFAGYVCSHRGTEKTAVPEIIAKQELPVPEQPKIPVVIPVTKQEPEKKIITPPAEPKKEQPPAAETKRVDPPEKKVIQKKKNVRKKISVPRKKKQPQSPVKPPVKETVKKPVIPQTAKVEKTINSSPVTVKKSAVQKNRFPDKLASGRMIPPFEKRPLHELLEMITAASGVTFIYCDFPASAARTVLPVESTSPIRADQLLQMILDAGKKRMHAVRQGPSIIRIYPGKTHLPYRSGDSIWAQREQVNWDAPASRNTEAFLNRILVDECRFTNESSLIFLAALSRNTGLRIQPGEGVTSGRITIHERCISLGRLIQEFCRISRCQAFYQNNGVVRIYKKRDSR